MQEISYNRLNLLNKLVDRRGFTLRPGGGIIGFLHQISLNAIRGHAKCKFLNTRSEIAVKYHGKNKGT
ncbi:MAG: hypothetical protein KAI27_02350 [Rhodospirillaceae bacterium]|nr:hypothetical protein [Rhodospirillaceae bacterium]